MENNTNKELIDYLNIDIKDDDSIEVLFNLLMKQIDLLESTEIDYKNLTTLTGVINKFINCVEYLNADATNLREQANTFIYQIRNNYEVKNEEEFFFRGSWFDKYIHRISLFNRIFNFNKIKNQYKNDLNGRKESAFYNFTNEIVLTYNSIVDNNKNSSRIGLNGFYTPESSDKYKATKLISEAIDILEKDNSLTDKAKKAIINYLKQALNEINKPKSNWTFIFGNLRETIFILGALGSLAGGITGVSALNDAKTKLNDATELIEKSSVNVNYQNINQIFNIEKEIDIEKNMPKLLLEDNDKK